MSKRNAVETALRGALSGGVLPHGAASRIARELGLSKSRVLFIKKGLGLASGMGLPPRAVSPVYRVNATVQCPDCHVKMAPHGAGLDVPATWRFRCPQCNATVTVDVPRYRRAVETIIGELRSHGAADMAGGNLAWRALAAVIETGNADLIMDASHLLAGATLTSRDPEMVELANHAAASGLREECALLRAAQNKEPASVVAKLAALKMPEVA